MNEYLLIINPNASKGKGKKKAEKISRLFKERGKSVDIAYTEKPGHAEEIALSAAESGYRNIVVCGGDGSVNEAINGIMKSQREGISLGIIPIGRGNDIAWNYGIKTRTAENVEKIIKGNGRKVDVGIVKGGYYPEGRYFLNGNGYGFESLVSHLAMEFRHLNGVPSYVAAFIRMLIKPPKPYSVTIRTQEAEQKVETLQISVSIGRRMGGTFILAPDALVDDGYFELMYTLHAFTRISLFLAALRFLRGTHLKHKKDFSGYRTKRVEIIWHSGDISSHVDGEVVSHMDGRDFLVEILERSLFVYM